jgi:cytochrome c oxidase subunit 2
MWFKARETGRFDIVCAELCGWGHYRMKGRATFEPRSEFENWVNAMLQEQQTRTVTVAEEEE